MHSSIVETLLQILHLFVCAVLILVVLLQQGRGGGMGAAFGGGGAAQVFGGRGAGNLLTRATGICAAIFMLTSVSLAYISSSGDRAIKAKAAMEEKKLKEKGSARPKEAPKDAPKETEGPKGDAPGTPIDLSSSGAGTGTGGGSSSGGAPGTPSSGGGTP